MKHSRPAPPAKAGPLPLVAPRFKSTRIKQLNLLRAQESARRSARLEAERARLRKICADADVAKDARTPGKEFPYAYGGAHDDVVAHNAARRALINLESNHSPPNASYHGTVFDDPQHEKYIPIGKRPAHAMLYYHHRSPRGRLGGASSTGGSGVNQPWAATLADLVQEGKFAEAMLRDFNDILNTTAPNRSYYATALRDCLLYAKTAGLFAGQQDAYEKLEQLVQSAMTVRQIAEKAEGLNDELKAMAD
jgi:hypothetical protein